MACNELLAEENRLGPTSSNNRSAWYLGEDLCSNDLWKLRQVFQLMCKEGLRGQYNTKSENIVF